MHIVVVPSLDELTVGNPIYPDTCPRDLFVRGLNALKLALVRAPERQASHDLIAFGDHILDGYMDAWEGVATAGDSAFD